MSRVRGGQVFIEIGADPKRLFKSLQDLNKHIGKIGSQLQGLGTRMTAFGAALAAPLALATRQFATFDDAIRATAAVSQASGAALQSLNDKARELGATTSFTAVQVANLMTELGRAGFKPDEIEAMTKSVLNLARATGTEASLSAKIMAETLRQFSMDAGHAARVSDVLTKTANSTNNTNRERHAGNCTASMGLGEKGTPRAAALRLGARISDLPPCRNACDLPWVRSCPWTSPSHQCERAWRDWIARAEAVTILFQVAADAAALARARQTVCVPDVEN
jgi:PIN domain nuclease of toxin-antitoxin system